VPLPFGNVFFVNVQTYLFFDGCCQQAIALYTQVMQAELLHVTHFSEAPTALKAPGPDHMVFHSTLKIGDTLLNLCDDPTMERGTFGGFVLLAHLDSGDAVDTAAKLLAIDGRLDLPSQQVPWANRYAIATDRFGVTWKLQFSE